MKITTSVLQKMKSRGEKITMLTAYDYTSAQILDECGIDIILVGDSLGNTMLGYSTTVKVTMEDMVHHTKAVARAVQNALVVADMPFLSYHTGARDAVINAGRLMREAGATAVKLEGGHEIIESVHAILSAGIPVMGHLGLLPQSVHKAGGYFVRGRTEDDAKKLLDDALLLQDAGVFALVLECVMPDAAKTIAQSLSIPVIGIGSGSGCDGQVLVYHDILGLTGGKCAKFVKRYANLRGIIAGAVAEYINEVKNSRFPTEEYTYGGSNA